MIEFSDAIRSSGLNPPVHIDAGRIIRFPGMDKGKNNKAAWCLLFDDCMGGVFGDYSTGLHESWRSLKSKTYTNDQRVEFDLRIAASRKQQAKERAELARKAAAKAQSLINAATISTHNYYRSKQLPEAIGFVMPEGELVLPMRDYQTDSLSGAQVIKWVDDKWEKKMIYGTRAKGAIFRIGNKSASTSILCEGMATGHSISMAVKMLCMDSCVVVCFSAANMVQVASMIEGRKMIFADNDVSNTGREAAERTGLPWCMSDTVGHDANDLHATEGIMAVCRKILDCRKQL